MAAPRCTFCYAVGVMGRHGGGFVIRHRDACPEGSQPHLEPVDFYSTRFTNFAVSHIRLVDRWDREHDYRTVEHRFQAMKAITPDEHDYVRRVWYPGEAKARGQEIALRPDWSAVRYDVMVEALRARYAIPRHRRALLETGNRLIREDSPTDFIWGYRSANGQDEGQNLLGIALMQVRDEIRAAS